MSLKTELIQLSVQDGTQMQAYTALPEGDGPFPGLIVFQEAFGVNHHIKSLCNRFAAEGYVVIAPELFHRSGEPGITIDYSDFPSAMPHMQAITPEGLIADSTAAFDWLQQHPQVQPGQIACTGYCMGGRTSFVANTALPLKAAISYYGGGIAPHLVDRAPQLHAPMLFFWGGLDEHIPAERIQQVITAMKDAGKKYINVEISYADHGFFCDERPSYNAQAAQDVWAITLSFLKTHLA